MKTIITAVLLSGSAISASAQFQKAEPAITILQTNASFKPDIAKPLAPDYQTRCYGFFCKRELKLDKHTPLPVRFRLGSMEQCNRLEGKVR